MVLSIRDVIFHSYDSYAHTARANWVIQWPGQVVLCVSQIYWTAEVHEALNEGRLSDYHEKLNVSKYFKSRRRNSLYTIILLMTS